MLLPKRKKKKKNKRKAKQNTTAIAIPRNEFLDRKKSQKKDSKLTCHILSGVSISEKSIKDLYIILACHEEHEKVFPDLSVIKTIRT